MARTIPKSIFECGYFPLWTTSRRFTEKGMRFISNGKSDAEHFACGPSQHKGSKCPKCKKKLTLLWDLDLSDPLIPGYVREGFAPADRLPFYICWQCVGASYRIKDNNKIKCFKFDSYSQILAENETPFIDWPLEFPRRRIAFERIPATIDALLSLMDTVGFDALDRPAKKILEEYFGTNINFESDISVSQFGGQPLPNQNHTDLVCPNPKCPASKFEHPYYESQQPFLMKEMALIHYNDEPSLSDHCFQLLYSICRVCFSIRAEYRCT